MTSVRQIQLNGLVDILTCHSRENTKWPSDSEQVHTVDLPQVECTCETSPLASPSVIIASFSNSLLCLSANIQTPIMKTKYFIIIYLILNRYANS